MEDRVYWQQFEADGPIVVVVVHAFVLCSQAVELISKLIHDGPCSRLFFLR
jgi:hypothetical protein